MAFFTRAKRIFWSKPYQVAAIGTSAAYSIHVMNNSVIKSYGACRDCSPFIQSVLFGTTTAAIAYVIWPVVAGGCIYVNMMEHKPILIDPLIKKWWQENK